MTAREPRHRRLPGFHCSYFLPLLLTFCLYVVFGLRATWRFETNRPVTADLLTLAFPTDITPFLGQSRC